MQNFEQNFSYQFPINDMFKENVVELPNTTKKTKIYKKKNWNVEFIFKIIDNKNILFMR